MKSRARTLADKSIEAMLAAIEIYNKPSFAYREESFSILAINAWELILKARLLQLAQNRVASIIQYERRRRADGTLSEKRYRAKNRSGTHRSIGLFGAVDRLRDEFGEDVPPAVRSNLEVVCEVRDNAVHFLNKGFDLSRHLQEVGTANVRNYLALVRTWFGVDLSSYNFFLMPLAFVNSEHTASAVQLNSDEQKLLGFVESRIASDPSRDASDFGVAVRIDLRMRRSKAGSTGAAQVVVTNDPDAAQVTLSEENIRERWPWSYNNLTRRLQKRYTNFKQNQKYHGIRKELEKDERFCRTRLLDPANTTGTSKRFYNPNILKEFDKHYERTS